MPTPSDRMSPREEQTTSNSPHEAVPGGLFACPFYKFNPQMYDECKRYQFKRISHMKQHLVRRHSLPPHSCPVCWSPFKDEQSKTNHLRHENCQRQTQPEQLSFEEINQMKHRGGDSSSHWLTIWHQLFDGYTAPASPYIQPNHIEEIKDLIQPGVEAAFNTSLPSLLQHNRTDMEISSFVKFILDSGCHLICRNLPESRHTPPSLPRVPNGGQIGRSQTPATIEPLLWEGDSPVNCDVKLGIKVYGDEVPEDSEFIMALDYDSFGSYLGDDT